MGSSTTPSPSHSEEALFSAEEMAIIYRDIHFDGCNCDECKPFNEWAAERLEQAISQQDLYGDQDSFDFDYEARLVIENRRSESMERDESAPSVEELKALFQGS